jgi:CheY-like chemotaxis protein
MQTQRRTRIANVKLLVVDDNRAVGDSVSATLSDQHQVDVVDSAQAALSRLKRSRYDVILCDLRMPNMNGIELFLALQNEGNGDERRLVFFTGAPISEPTRSFLHRHGRICVAKPISEEQLERAVREVLQDLTNEVPARATGAGA